MNVPGSQLPLRRYRRRILGWGAVGVVGVFAVGAAIFGAHVENDLKRRVVEEFNDAQVGPVMVSFSGQDGTLLCLEGAVDIPNELLERSRALWGVASLDLDESCMQAAISADGAASAVSATEPDLVADNGVIHAIDHVLLPVGVTIGADTNEPLLTAEADAATLADRGIATDLLTTAGFGGSQPIVDVAGVEDKAASRRVEFAVTVQ